MKHNIAVFAGGGFWQRYDGEHEIKRPEACVGEVMCVLKNMGNE